MTLLEALRGDALGEQALRGEIWTETVAGTLGPSVRAIVPIQDEDGTVHGMVATGVTVTNVSVAIAARLPFVILTAGIDLSVGAISEVVGDLQRASGATERLFDLMATRPEMIWKMPVMVRTQAANATPLSCRRA